MNLDYPPGATPLDPDEAAGLIPSHIANHGQLNEWEMVNILAGEQWAFGRRHPDLLGNGFICRLHKRMFGDTWRWAGAFRSTEMLKNFYRRLSAEGLDITLYATEVDGE